MAAVTPSDPTPEQDPDFEQIDRDLNAVERTLRELRRELEEIARLLKRKKIEEEEPEDREKILAFPYLVAI